MTRTTSKVDASPMRRSLACLLTSLLLIGGMGFWFVTTYHGPPAKPQSANVSAARAMETLESLLGDGAPHPAGSPENEAFRERLVGQLESLGLTVERSPFEVDGVRMQNVLVRIAGDLERRPLLLATHYDSVPQGPGAGDAGSCVAALVETTRALNEQRKKQPHDLLARDVFLLFTDGEEYVPDVGRGLNGASYFAEWERGELFSRNPLVFNFDARGATGPSLLFETNRGNRRLMQAALPALPRRAFTASSFVAVYNLLPNATDLTVFKQQGMEGLNFGFIDDPHRYHTPDDTLANLDPRSVQHHAENAWAMANRFLMLDQDDFTDDEDAVFFTLFGHWIVCYPESLAIPLATMILVIQLIGSWLSLRRGASLSGLFVTAGAVFLAVLMSLLIGFNVSLLVRSGVLEHSAHGFSEHDPWLVGGMWSLAFAACALSIGWTSRSRRVSAESVWATVWLGWALVGLLTAMVLPGFSYMMLAVGLCPALLSMFSLDRQVSTVIAVGLGSIVLVPIGYQFGIALGPRMALGLSVLYVLMLTPLFPALVWNRNPPPVEAIQA